MVNDGVWCFMMVYDGLRGYNEDIYIYIPAYIQLYTHCIYIHKNILRTHRLGTIPASFSQIQGLVWLKQSMDRFRANCGSTNEKTNH
jgi:hypothetical protein